MELLSNKGEIIKVPIAKNNTISKSPNEWEMAHTYFEKSIKSGNKVSFVEPNISSELYSSQSLFLTKNNSNTGYLKNWPEPKDQPNKFVWHLNDEYSQLREASNRVLDKFPKSKIKIAIIDTGFQPNHPVLPKNLLPGISFVKGEEGAKAIDIEKKGLFEQQGHGTATAGFLAGGYLTKEQTNGLFEGEFGGIPFAEVLPIRISDTVALIKADTFVSAVKYAINQGCEVISMSMAGVPSKSWAKIVNKAYENGVVLVTAAGNSWNKGIKKVAPKRLLYPARWGRVIAATGVCADQLPYVFKARVEIKSANGEHMQGNYGPAKVMGNALAAYTPNTSWATINNDKNKTFFSLNGGGTSSATPQIAAAAALYICYYRKEIEGILAKDVKNKWKKVEIVKKALFDSAYAEDKENMKYYGRGILKAFEALNVKPSENNLILEPKATLSWLGIKELIGTLVLRKANKKTKVIDEMLETEVLQAMHNNEALHDLLNYGNNDKWSKDDLKILKAQLEKQDISIQLRNRLNN